MDPMGTGISKMIRGDNLIPSWAEADQKPPKDVPQPLKTYMEHIALKKTK